MLYPILVETQIFNGLALEGESHLDGSVWCLGDRRVGIFGVVARIAQGWLTGRLDIANPWPSITAIGRQSDGKDVASSHAGRGAFWRSLDIVKCQYQMTIPKPHELNGRVVVGELRGEGRAPMTAVRRVTSIYPVSVAASEEGDQLACGKRNDIHLYEPVGIRYLTCVPPLSVIIRNPDNGDIILRVLDNTGACGVVGGEEPFLMKHDEMLTNEGAGLRKQDGWSGPCVSLITGGQLVDYGRCLPLTGLL